MIKPSEDLRRSVERQNETYHFVRCWTEEDNRELTSGWTRTPGWAYFCCSGCHGCCGVPLEGGFARPIDAHLARLEYFGKIPVSASRLVDPND